MCSSRPARAETSGATSRVRWCFHWSVAKCGYDTLAKRPNRKCQFVVRWLTLRARLAGLGVRMSLLTPWRHKAFTAISHGRTLDSNIHWEAEMLLCLIKVVGYCGTSLAIAQRPRRTQEFTIRWKVQMLMSATGQKGRTLQHTQYIISVYMHGNTLHSYSTLNTYKSSTEVQS